MINVGSIVKVICNSGAKTARIIAVYREKIRIGTQVKVSILSINKKISSKVKKHEKHFAILSRLKISEKRSNNSRISSSFNGVVLIRERKSFELVGSNIMVTLPYELSNQYESFKKAGKQWL